MTGWAGWCLRVAGANGIVNGLGFGGFTIPAMVSLGRGRGILYTFGNPTYGNGPFERIGVPTSVPLLAAFLAACLLQVVGGVLLLWPRRSGIVVSIAGLLLRPVLVGVRSSVRVAQRGGAARVPSAGVDSAKASLNENRCSTKCIGCRQTPMVTWRRNYQKGLPRWDSNHESSRDVRADQGVLRQHLYILNGVP
ncbi:MAG TPA: hypothetical protein VNB91_00310 [Jatrophihabitantaceae bacterium]|nr:hypothetical protein [Jatrophihabitantaceae bacterium]